MYLVFSFSRDDNVNQIAERIGLETLIIDNKEASAQNCNGCASAAAEFLIPKEGGGRGKGGPEIERAGDADRFRRLNLNAPRADNARLRDERGIIHERVSHAVDAPSFSPGELNFAK